MSLRDRAPEGLIPWIREQKDIDWPEYLIYKAGWERDPVTGLSNPCADAVCTACGARMKLARAYGARCGTGNATFGVGMWLDGNVYEQYGSGQQGVCPECGKTVAVKHSTAANKLYRYVWPMSFERAGETLICTLWRVEREVRKDGSVRFSAVPWEAYLFGAKSAAVYKRWSQGAFYGRAHPADSWTALKKFEDRAYDIDLVYCPEGIAEATRGTCMENSKLELYMGITSEYRFPIAWLRLFQKRGAKAETLMTCGAAKLAAGMIAEEKRKAGYGRAAWTRSANVLTGLNWREKKPAAILRLTKDELGYFAGKQDGLRRLQAIQAARKAGLRMRPGDEDGSMTVKEQLSLVRSGILPAKARRYLNRQKEKYGREWGVSYLEDYWGMAQRAELDLSDEAVRWPQNLTGAHDRLLATEKDIKSKLPDEAFRKRYEKMSRYSWEKDGIFIRPARSDAELKAEGKALHHCVGSYAGRHAVGELTIFFIRRTEEPDKPWFTLNYNEREKSVTENRGLCNCERTPEVKAFEAAWLEWVRAGCKRENGGRGKPLPYGEERRDAGGPWPVPYGEGEPGKKGDRAA